MPETVDPFDTSLQIELPDDLEQVTSISTGTNGNGDPTFTIVGVLSNYRSYAASPTMLKIATATDGIKLFPVNAPPVQDAYGSTEG